MDGSGGPVHKTRIIVLSAYGVGAVLIGAAVVIYSVGALLVGLSWSGVTDGSEVSVTGAVVSVGPGRVVNEDEIAEARKGAEEEGIPLSQAAIPRRHVGTCTVTYAFDADGARYEGVDLEPRQASWCGLRAGDAVYIAYPVGHPELSSDDYNRYQAEAQRAWERTCLAVGGAAVLVIASGVTVHVRARRRPQLEVAAQR